MKDKDHKPLPSLSDKVGKKESLKLRAKRGARSPWYGLGMFGMIGWSVVVPTVGGVLLGIWLDKRYPFNYSWTLTFLMAGLCMGCFNAWYWVSKENKEIQKEQEDKK